MTTKWVAPVLEALRRDPAYASLQQGISGAGSVAVSGLFGPTACAVTAMLGSDGPAPLVVVPTEVDAGLFVRDLGVLGVDDALVLPWWETIPYRAVGTSGGRHGARARVLSQLVAGDRKIVVVPLRAYLTRLPPPRYIAERTREIAVGDEIDPHDTASFLIAAGYDRVSRVAVHGEFALRGEVLDVFPPGDDEAIRVVLDFDTVSEIRRFDPGTQQSLGRPKRVGIYPAREVVWADDELSRLLSAGSALPEFRRGLDGVVDEFATKGRVAGEEMFYPLAVEGATWIDAYLPEGTPVVMVDYERLIRGEESVRRESDTLFRQARSDRAVPRPERFLGGSERFSVTPRAELHLLRDAEPDDSPTEISLRFDTEAPRSYFGNISFFREELSGFLENGYRLFVSSESEHQAERIRGLLNSDTIAVTVESLSAGFTLPRSRIMVLQERELFGRRRRRPDSTRAAKSRVIDTFVDLSPGDYVVHVNYGIGLFTGIERLSSGGTERDYIRLEFAEKEFVFLPIEQVNLIQRYIGGSGSQPKLDRLGGKSWDARKAKARKNVEDLAEQLIELYGKRRRSTGRACPPDGEWQYEFEAAFPYEETPDQLRCIDEMKADMERPEPMDRLICGDVGYGKTEIAVRGAFKAVAAGRQVAYLAPTTILVEQHYETFTERIEGFPVTVAMLSRFVPKPRQKEVLKQLADGSLDIVIGTQRILQKDVRFRDLGLLVIDEEQRFGVKDKERLKELRTNVDCLTLTATPIPRTLHMSLLKIRDMSVLTTPPNNRRPIETVVREFDESLIARAIRNEVSRGGQVFYLHNRVETLEAVQRFLVEIVPEVMAETAHGQMAADELEDVMHRFIHGAFQILVSTTIIENGIDIPNVNTIIIDRADMYGIAQLYQLRGRVGRSDRTAYAYLLYPEQRVLSEQAMKRLQVISDNTELGSGFKVAMKDMEVRGAGNLLGRQQSGAIASVGFEMYAKLLDDAVRRLESADFREEIDPYLELDYSGFIPDEYVEDPMTKMEVYKKIAGVADDVELDAVHGELADRFGPPPEEIESLLSLAEIRILCRRLSVRSLRERSGTVRVEFAEVAKLSVEKVVEMMRTSAGAVRPDPHAPNVLILSTERIGLKEKSEFIRDRLSALF